jgi:hypothetical protein
MEHVAERLEALRVARAALAKLNPTQRRVALFRIAANLAASRAQVKSTSGSA